VRRVWGKRGEKRREEDRLAAPEKSLGLFRKEGGSLLSRWLFSNRVRINTPVFVNVL